LALEQIIDERIAFTEVDGTKKIKITADVIFTHFVDWAGRNGIIEKISKIQFGHEIAKIVKSKNIKIEKKVLKGYDFTQDELCTELKQFIKAGDLEELL